jgi:hypothetical protein
VLLLGPSASSTATELSECVTLSVNPSGDAVLTNGCGSVLNITYCVDNARSDKSCSNTALGVTTLSAGGSDLIAAYIDEVRAQSIGRFASIRKRCWIGSRSRRCLCVQEDVCDVLMLVG